MIITDALFPFLVDVMTIKWFRKTSAGSVKNTFVSLIFWPGEYFFKHCVLGKDFNMSVLILGRIVPSTDE